MNILIIGNGFDLAHKLPTSYKEFIKFIEQICRIENYQGTAREFESKIEITGYDKFNDLDVDIQAYIHDIICDKDNPNRKVVDFFEQQIQSHNKGKKIQFVKELITLSKDNIWIKWFQKELNIHSGWIDFEAEISRVVQQFEKIQSTTLKETLDIRKISDFESSIINLFTNGKNPLNQLTYLDFDKFKDKMLYDLNNLIRCFEIYLEDYVRDIDKKLLSPDIYDLKIDKLLSFNYTDTYQRLYSCKNRSIKYDYIHGKSKIEAIPENNMVLGIDEYLQGEELFSNVKYIEFKKYYQRLHKKTDCDYIKWLDEISNSKDEIHNVYIFGHSLAMTDKDVLKEFIKHSKIYTTIYYVDKNRYGEQIANLVQMLGPDTLNAMVYGENPKIKFKPQQNMIDRTDSEWEILNDRHLLWRLEQLSDNDINTLLAKIKDKLNSSDLTYFHDQENLISLYNALILNVGIGKKSYEKFLNIAQLLYNEKTYHIFHKEQWDNADYYGYSECDSNTAKLIKEINEYNSSIKPKELSQVITYDLNILYEQLSESSISEELAFELFDKVYEKFKTSDENLELVWKCIHKLSQNIDDDKWQFFVNERIKASGIVDRIRFNHIQYCIDESNYYEEMARQQAEQYEEDEDAVLV